MGGIQDGNGLIGGEGGVGFTLADGNGTTANGSKCDLGGDIIQDTILSFDPTDKSIFFGDGVDYYFGFGNVQGDGEVKLISGVDFVDISTSVDTNNEYSQYSVNKKTGLFSTVIQNIKHQTEGTGYDYGLAILDKTKFGGQGKSSNIYYGTSDGAGNTTDLIRIEVLATDEATSHAHMRRFIDFTTPVNYNGVHISRNYSQLEYNKQAEDGQDTGTLWVLDADGASMFKDGVKVFRIKNSVPSYADDAAATVGGLTTGDVYKTTTGGSTFLKIVP